MLYEDVHASHWDMMWYLRGNLLEVSCCIGTVASEIILHLWSKGVLAASRNEPSSLNAELRAASLALRASVRKSDAIQG